MSRATWLGVSLSPLGAPFNVWVRDIRASRPNLDAAGGTVSVDDRRSQGIGTIGASSSGHGWFDSAMNCSRVIASRFSSARPSSTE